jgi:hypothetical protein
MDSRIQLSRWINSSNGSGVGPSLKAEMLVTAVMTVMCGAGIAFYLRFLVALREERKPRLIGYWARLRLGSSENAKAERQEREKPTTRAA